MRVTWLKWNNPAGKRNGTGWIFGPAGLAGSIVALIAAIAQSAKPETRLTPLEPDRAEAARLLRQAIDVKRTDVASLTEKAKKVAEILGTDSLVAQDLLHAVRIANKPQADPEAMLAAFEKTHKTLIFQPLMEAGLPQGFPAPGPLGEIRVKEYPRYRMAVSNSGGAAFWTLFRHITRNDIAMTAPVEMDYGDVDSAKAEETSMAFLYANPELGQTGSDGTVEVVDAPPITVVSIGLRGPRSDTMIEEARQQLMAWIDTHREYEICGPLRVLGYNSPFVPRERQFWEVQVPIRQAAGQSPDPA